MRFCRMANAAALSVLALLALGSVAWSAPIQITTGEDAHLGTHLTESNGQTVYVFTDDMEGMSHCDDACAKVWPPVLTTGKPMAGPGVKADLIGTIDSGDQQQVTYNGMPLYTFIRDTSAGAVNGEGINHFGGSWYVVAPEGKGILPNGKQE